MSYLFVANWKMRMHFAKAVAYCTDNKQELISLNEHHSLIICPSFIALQQIIDILQNTNVKIGAQDCSSFKEGSHTGEVSAQSLQEIGCSYCIVGHSERRMHETNESVAEKVIRLLLNNITPIICIGETNLDAINSRTYSVLEEQLQPIFLALQSHNIQKIDLIVAYEPTWAIGTGVIPNNNYLKNIFAWLQEIITTNVAFHTLQLLYGGSVDEKNIRSLTQIPHINGFLIGGASTDLAQFKAIIKSANTEIL